MVNIQDDALDKISELSTLRGYKVVKSNEIIQKSRFQLNAQEQKIILYMISKIKPNDGDFIIQDFRILEFCKVCGIENDSGSNYKTVKDTIKALADKSLWIVQDNGTEVLVRWINKAWVNKKSGTIKLRLDDDMKPYLLQLSAKFTQYELLYALAMPSQYSIRLYEILKSYEWKQLVIFDIDDLKRMLSAENYARFPDFKRYVLDIAMRDINDLSDLTAKFEIIKVGRKFGKIKFYMQIKKDMDERLRTFDRIDKIINAKHPMNLLDKFGVES